MVDLRGLRTTAPAALVAVAVAFAGSTVPTSDEPYTLPVWFEWREANLDILIVPPEHGQVVNGNGLLGGQGASEGNPCTTSYMAAIRASILGWQKGIEAYGAAWTRGIAIHTYEVGCGPTPPTEALMDPEIVVVTDETKLFVLGVAVNSRPCIVDSSKFFLTSFTYEDMYNINGHEVGHCLGLDHVKNDRPAHDVMAGTYADTPGATGTHLHCVSNLDVAAIELAFGRQFGQPAGGAARVAPAGYKTMVC